MSLTLLRYAIAAVLGLVGLIFVGQGAGLIPGSFMTGQRTWLIVGVMLLVVGAVLAWRTWRLPRR